MVALHRFHCTSFIPVVNFGNTNKCLISTQTLSRSEYVPDRQGVLSVADNPILRYVCKTQLALLYISGASSMELRVLEHPPNSR